MFSHNTSEATRLKMLPRRRMDKRRRTRGRRHLRAPRRLFCDISQTSKKQSSSKAVARKMEALRELIPSSGYGGGEEKLPKAAEAASTSAPERLFGETAEYILALRAQIDILKRLVDFYSAPIHQENGNAA